MAVDARIGTEVAGYRIEGAVARGGMGVVYRAQQLRLGRPVALKLLAPELANNEGFRARFEHESRLAAAIDHPNIIPLYEAGEADGLLFLSMRFVDGIDLKRLLALEGRLDPPRALAIVSQMASALDAAHARGLVHRDVKPGNVLVASGIGPESSDHCYLVDFGLTKDTSAAVELTATGTFVGTIDYVAPEQIDGSPPDGRSDEYSLAAVLFECLTAHPPFLRDNDVAVMWAHMQDSPPSLSAERPDLPVAIDAVIAKAMAKAPADRYPSCTEFVAAARAALEAGSPGAERSPAPAAAVGPLPGAETRLSASPAAATEDGVAPPVAVTVGAAAPAPVPAPPAAPVAAHGTRTSIVVAGALVVAAAAAGGVVAGSSGSGSEAKASSAIAGPVALRYGDPWQRGGDSHAIPGLALRDSAVLNSGRATAIAGVIAKPGAALLPAALRPASSSVVRLGSTTALRHTLAGGATVYVVPTTSGPVAIGCTGPASAGCDGIAASVRLTSARALDARPDAGYASRLATILAGANPSLAGLARAPTSTVQAARARALRVVHERIARRVRGLAAPAPAVAANRAIAGAASAIAAAYGDLAAAAAAHDASRYAAAVRAVRRTRGVLSRAIGDLTRLGYRVEG